MHVSTPVPPKTGSARAEHCTRHGEPVHWGKRKIGAISEMKGRAEDPRSFSYSAPSICQGSPREISNAPENREARMDASRQSGPGLREKQRGLKSRARGLKEDEKFYPVMQKKCPEMLAVWVNGAGKRAAAAGRGGNWRSPNSGSEPKTDKTRGRNETFGVWYPHDSTAWARPSFRRRSPAVGTVDGLAKPLVAKRGLFCEISYPRIVVRHPKLPPGGWPEKKFWGKFRPGARALVKGLYLSSGGHFESSKVLQKPPRVLQELPKVLRESSKSSTWPVVLRQWQAPSQLTSPMKRPESSENPQSPPPR